MADWYGCDGAGAGPVVRGRVGNRGGERCSVNVAVVRFTTGGDAERDEDGEADDGEPAR